LNLAVVVQVRDDGQRAVDPGGDAAADGAEEDDDARDDPDLRVHARQAREPVADPAEAAAEDEVEQQQRREVAEQDEPRDEDGERREALDAPVRAERRQPIDHARLPPPARVSRPGWRGP
jgi:hypothetical protein